MKILREDCEIKREPGWNRIRHLPTNRCVACNQDSVTDDELFGQLVQDLEFLKTIGKENDHKELTFMTITEELIH